MTQVERQDVVEETGGWYLYRFRPKPGVTCATPGCGIRHPVYIGKSNDLWRRHSQHMGDKWWSHLIGGYDIDPRVFASDQEVLAAEREAILDELPLANDQHNRDNPCRLVFDPTAHRTPVARTRRDRRPPGRPAARLSRRWVRRRNQATAVVAIWAVLAGLLWVGSGHLGLAGDTRVWTTLGASTGSFLGCWSLTFPRESFVRKATAVALAVGLLWLALTLAHTPYVAHHLPH